MTKLTKREYNRTRNIMLEEMARIDKKLESLNKWGESIDYNNMTDKQRDKWEKIGDYWNGLHDSKSDLEKELNFLEDKWDRRNWTQSDWNSWELVSLNID